MTGRPRVLVLRALGLGDLLTAVPALRGIARAYPDAERLLAAPAPLEPLVRLVDGVDRLVPVHALGQLPEDAHGAELAVNLHGKGPQSHRVLLGARPERLVAFRNPQLPVTYRFPSWVRDEHEVARWCRMLGEWGIPCDPSDLDLRPPDRPVPTVAHGATVVHPGAASAARRWPPARFAAVAHHERRAGRSVVVTGSAAERPVARRIAREADLPPDAVLAGTTDLLDVVAVVAAAGRVVCGDTGVGHLATALRTPSVVLFGPVSPSWWGPPPDRPWHRAIWKGRTGDPHADRLDPGLEAVTVDDVVAELDVLDALTALDALDTAGTIGTAGTAAIGRARRLLEAGPWPRHDDQVSGRASEPSPPPTPGPRVAPGAPRGGP